VSDFAETLNHARRRDDYQLWSDRGSKLRAEFGIAIACEAAMRHARAEERRKRRNRKLLALGFFGLAFFGGISKWLL
jgi:hypothetical protein